MKLRRPGNAPTGRTFAERANIGRAKVRAAIKLAESLGIIAIGETPPGGERVIVNRGITSRC